MDDPTTRLYVDTTLMRILIDRVGAHEAAVLIDDLAWSEPLADRRMAIVLGGARPLFRASTRWSTIPLMPATDDAEAWQTQSMQQLDYIATLGAGARWMSMGRMLSVESVYPDSVMLSMVGRPLADVCDDPALPGGMTIEEVWEEGGTTYFAATAEGDAHVITLAEAMGDERTRMTKHARAARRGRRRRMMAASSRDLGFWTWLAAVAVMTVASLYPLTRTSDAADFIIGLATINLSLMLSLITVITAIVMGPKLLSGIMVTQKSEQAYADRLQEMALQTAETAAEDAATHKAVIASTYRRVAG